MEKVFCGDSWQTTRRPSRQDHGHPFGSPAGQQAGGEQPCPAPLLPKQVAAAEGPRVVRKSRGFPHRKAWQERKHALPQLFSWRTSAFHRPKLECSPLKKPGAATIGSPLPTAMKEWITCTKPEQYPQQIKPHSGSIKGKRKAE